MTYKTIALLTNMYPSNIGNIFRGHYLPSIETLEKLTAVLGLELELLESSPKSAAVQCLSCGSWRGFISVHGHIACRTCGAVIETCCE